jgi:hypothetical protein
MNVNYKKSLKMVTLLISALLIATVSATIYSYMYIEGSGNISGEELKWELGTDAPSGASIQGSYVKTLNLTIPKNSPKNFTDCLRIVNNNATGIRFDLEISSVGGDISKFSTFKLIVYNSTNDPYATLNVKLQGDKASNLYIMGGGTKLTIRFEVTPVTDEASAYMPFTVKLTYH